MIDNFIIELAPNKELKQPRDLAVGVEGPLQPLQSALMAWTLHVDGLYNDNNCGVNLVLSSLIPECLEIQYTLRLIFKASDNEAEYKALLIGLRLTQVVGARHLDIFSNF